MRYINLRLTYLLTYYNPLMSTLKPQSSRPLYVNTAIGTLVIDGWAVAFGTARRGLDGIMQKKLVKVLQIMRV